MKINKIAVCMYGQYRTGLELSSTIANYFDIPKKEVDFFCSVKVYNKYFNSTTEQIINHAFDNSMVEAITNDVFVKYNPKLSNFIFIDSDSTNLLSGQNGVYSAMIDVLQLKQEYECKNKFQYDLVIMFRYDTIIQPTDYFKKLTKLLEFNVDIYGNHIVTRTKNDYQNFILVTMGLPSPIHAGPNLPNVGDMCFVCNSESADLLYSQLILLQSEKHQFNHQLNTLFNVKVKFYNGSGHFKWSKLFNSVSIHCIEFPVTFDDSSINYDPTMLEYNNSQLQRLLIVPIRNSNINKNDDYTDPKVLVHHGILWSKNVTNQSKLKHP